MNFTFSEDQEIFRDAFKKYLESNVTPEKIRSGWEDNMPFNQARWQELEELGILQSNLDEKYGGLGLDLVTSCLLVEEMGYYALPEPAAEQIFLSNLLINKSIDIAELIEEKNQFIGVTHSLSPNILFLDNSSKQINLGEDSISIVSSKDINGKKLKSSDPSRDLTNFIFENSDSGLLQTLNDQKSLVNNVATSGMVMSAAILVGLSRKILDLATAYTLDRKQFDKPIGSFQAVKHMLAQAAIEIEFSKATLYRAAYSLDNDNPLQKLHAAQAKLQAIDACEMASRNSMQAHGAMGYTWEMDLHIFIRRGWSYKQVWGNKSLLENYIMKVQIDARVIGDLALNHIIPTAIIYQNKLIQNANGLKGLGIKSDDLLKL